MLSITQQLDLIAENQNLLAVDDDPAILSYFREVFAPFAHGSHEQISELMDLMGGREKVILAFSLRWPKRRSP